ncbi:acyl-CoA thioesterase [Bacillus aquiflavi]|uniref:Acyl-CoA thioesterase n=1 Tax=Bacillus aquiflavi TaxID=2672567 RepID=A0A6B3W560_9BACI|nr:thioesterase family protein [Bacillus aquiflavi]MBA4538508.1 acyl-CoA thioesterase [Bacillus aquiflavi]NEY82871.1 acyl-CoA thioesterase [Bacillus aquiflavi]UAC49564.1 acyl-CoA thioesterase [Bacillus aquiflavi]
MLVSTKEVEVRYAETDQMGVVYHANYLVWMELGRTKLVKDLGFNYAKMEEDGIISPVIDIEASYKKPLRYGETAKIKTWIEEYNGFKVTYGYEIFTETGELAVMGFSKHVCVKKATFKPISIKRSYPEWHLAYEKAKKHA